MPILLPFVAGLLLLGVCSSCGKPWRRSLLESMTVWGGYLAATTELLGSIGEITKTNVALAWLGLICTCIGTILLRLRRDKPRWELPKLARLDSVEWLALVAILMLLALTGIAAFVSPPNTWDVMEYHMPRVVQWIERRSLAYYPTHDCPQLFYPPFAEWTILHFHLLAGSDRFSNLVQWCSFIGCIIGASYAAELLGAKRQGQWIAALLSATLPIAVLAASGSKNDLVLAFWTLSAGAFALDLCKDHSISGVVFVGLAAGLALLTKWTAYLLCPPLIAGCLLPCLRERAARRLISWLLIPAIIVVVNAGHYARNMNFTGSPMGLSSPNGDGIELLRIQNPTIRTTAANLVRNVALHLGTGSLRLNARINSILRAAISTIGVDPDNKDATRSVFRVNPHTYNEYFAGSPFHFILLSAAILWTLLRRRYWRIELVSFVLGVFAAFVSFSALVPWWPTSARLHTAPLIFSMAAIAVLLERAWRPISTLLLATTCVVAMKSVVNNQFRPLTSSRGTTSIFRADRWTQYFVDIGWHLGSYTATVAEIKESKCREIGIDASLGERFEYPLLLALGAGPSQARVWDVGVGNPSARLASSFEANSPCAVVCIGCISHKEKFAKYGPDLPLSRTFGRLVLFEQSRDSRP